jgi:uncharacterized protein (TIGR02996 family)
VGPFETVVWLVRAQRDLRVPVDPAERQLDMTARLTAVAKRVGLAPHTGAPLLTIVDRVLAPIPHGLAGEALARVRWVCVHVLLDGYDLAGVMTHVTARGQGKAFRSEADLTAFAERTASMGEALIAFGYGEYVHALLEPEVAVLPPELGAIVARAGVNAMAAGMLLHLHEHGAAHPVLTRMATAVRAAAARRRGRAKERMPRRAESAELLAGVLAAPDDDAPRLVYADWLCEHGDPLGEWIQLSCMGGEQTEERARRGRELLRRHEKAWLAPIRRYVRVWRFARGFVAHVVADLGKFLTGIDALAEVPLASARLTGFRSGHANAISDAAAHPTLARIDLSSNGIDLRSADVLAMPFWSRAVLLVLDGNPLGTDGLDKIGGLQSDALRMLSLSRTRAHFFGMRDLPGAAWWPRLTHLSLGQNPELDGRVVDVLASAQALEVVVLDGTSFDDNDAVRLAERAPHRLEAVSVSGTRVGASGLAALKERFAFVTYDDEQGRHQAPHPGWDALRVRGSR